MNERIQDLAEQTGFEFNSLGGTYTSGTLSDKLDKFAELIIRECAEIALREDHDPHECIKQHFGIDK